MGSLHAEIRGEHHDAEQCEWSYPRRDERQQAQRGSGDGRSGPDDPMRAQHGDEQDHRSDPGGRADVHQRMPRVEAGSRRPKCAKRSCEEERNREYDLGGLQVVGRVLSVRDNAVREHDLKGEHE
jgi:hypothetical protein